MHWEILNKQDLVSIGRPTDRMTRSRIPYHDSMQSATFIFLIWAGMSSKWNCLKILCKLCIFVMYKFLLWCSQDFTSFCVELEILFFVNCEKFIFQLNYCYNLLIFGHFQELFSYLSSVGLWNFINYLFSGYLLIW
jgi:hypothetical protein